MSARPTILCTIIYRFLYSFQKSFTHLTFTMLYSTVRTEVLFFLLALLYPTHAVPAPQAPSSASPTPSGSLRGSNSLAGYSSSNQLTEENTDAIKYQLVPGQTDDAVLGEYLDFEENPLPQPIRGSKGGTDPGPRKLLFTTIEYRIRV